MVKSCRGSPHKFVLFRQFVSSIFLWTPNRTNTYNSVGVGHSAEDAKSKSEGSVQSEEVSESSKLTDTEVASILSEKHRKLEEASRKRAA